MIEMLLSPFQYEYMRSLFLVSVAIGIVAGGFSLFLNLRNWALAGDALAHSVIPGVALALILGVPYLFGALFSVLLAGGSFLLLSHLTTLRQEALIGLIFTLFMALGLLLINLYPTSLTVERLIFGNILGVTPVERWQILRYSGGLLLILLLFWRTFQAVLFDETQSHTIGIAPLFWQGLFFALLSVLLVMALQSVGALLIVALVIIPGAAALLVGGSFVRMLLFALAFGGVTAFLGVYGSFFLGTASGSTTVLLQFLLFLSLFFVRKGGS